MNTVNTTGGGEVMTDRTNSLSKRIGLRVKILVATIVVVAGFTGVFLYQSVSFHTESALNQVVEPKPARKHVQCHQISHVSWRQQDS
ncbi:MAG: hypothetical protein JRJ38_02520 [Deltaproteobacteria bacterium]|nr:hypothetical protein [Deltaproteobacteria bacterium]